MCVISLVCVRSGGVESGRRDGLLADKSRQLIELGVVSRSEVWSHVEGGSPLGHVTL